MSEYSESSSEAETSQPLRRSTRSRTRRDQRQSEEEVELEEHEEEGEEEEDEEEAGEDGDDEDDEESAGEGDVEEIPKRVQALLDVKGSEGVDREFFVKYHDMSYLHCEWVPEAVILEHKMGKNRIRKFFSHRVPEDEGEEPFDPQFITVDRVIAFRSGLYLVKWHGLGYDEATWEYPEMLADDAKITEFEEREKFPGKAAFRAKRRPKPETWSKYEASPEYRNDNQLRSYQLEALNWLTYNWYQGRNTILADEMGLGKTVQAMSIVNHLFTQEDLRGPFLVVAPLSTLAHWKREFEGWTHMNTIIYHGNQAARDLMNEHELYYPNTKFNKFHVLVTTYETILSQAKLLGSFRWKYLVVDEAHRLKNTKSKLLERLRKFRIEHMLLMTGTPLQNNTQELWSLLNYLDPKKFADVDQFLRKFGDLQGHQQLQDLQTILRPRMLRRMKEDVEKGIAAKEEIIVEVELTNLQKRYYRAIYERNFQYLSKQASAPSLLNVVMQLRKCCNHPYLLNGVEEEIVARVQATTYQEKMKALVAASGKLVLIDKLLPKLRADNHKVLIFSQFTRVLDIIEDYLRFKEYGYERIDGRIRGNARQAAIDRFSAPDSSRFCFLLSTRAGGVGINLTSADTVIIYDSDWNPQNDIQAQARCHRIGQKNVVKVYRLITRNTYEKEMFIKASKKLGLDQAVLQEIQPERGADDFDPHNMKKEELDDLLKHGAYDVFREGKDQPEAEYDEDDIDRILERSSVTVQYSGVRNAAMANLSKAAFVSERAQADIDLDDPDFWKKLLPEHSIIASDPRIIHHSRRRHKTQRYTELDMSDGAEEQHSDDNLSYKVDTRDMDWSQTSRDRLRTALSQLGFGRWEEIKDKGRLRPSVDEIQSFSEAVVTMLCSVAEVGDISARLNLIYNGEGSYVSMAEKLARAKVEQLKAPAEDQKDTPGAAAPATPLLQELQKIQVPDYRNHPTLTDKKFMEYVVRNAGLLLNRLEDLRILGDYVRKCATDDPRSTLVVPPNLPAASKPSLEWWDDSCDRLLIYGTYEYGHGRYKEMWADPAYTFPNKVGKPAEEHEKLWEEVGQKALNLRMRKIYKTLGAPKVVPKKKKPPKAKKKRKAEAAAAARALGESTWSKREKSDFQRTLVNHGVPFSSSPDSKSEAHFDWAAFTLKAKLNKTPKMVEEYYAGLMAHCAMLLEDPLNAKNKSKSGSRKKKAKTAPASSSPPSPLPPATAPPPPPAAAQEITSPTPPPPPSPSPASSLFIPVSDEVVFEALAAPVESPPASPEPPSGRMRELRSMVPEYVEHISLVQVNKLLRRLTLFSDLRVKALPLGREELAARVLAVQPTTVPKGLPSWWNAEAEVDLLYALDVYGTHWELMVRDREKFCFARLGNAKVEPEEKEAEGGAKGSKKKPRKDRAEYCKAVAWPSDGDLFARVRQLLNFVLWEENWYRGRVLKQSKKLARAVVAAHGKDTEKATLIAGVYGVKPPTVPSAKKKNPPRVKVVPKKRKLRSSNGNPWMYEEPEGLKRDAEGNLELPLKINDKLTLVALGEICADPGYHSPKYLYPIGFRSQRLHYSTVDHTKKVSYTSDILKGKTKALFRVTASDTNEVFEGNSASNVWNQIVDRVNATKSKHTGKHSKTTASGPDFVGYADKFIHAMLQELPGVDECSRYVRKPFVKAEVEDGGAKKLKEDATQEEEEEEVTAPPPILIPPPTPIAYVPAPEPPLATKRKPETEGPAEEAEQEEQTLAKRVNLEEEKEEPQQQVAAFAVKRSAEGEEPMPVAPVPPPQPMEQRSQEEVQVDQKEPEAPAIKRAALE